jgi:hypothetical protein
LDPNLILSWRFFADTLGIATAHSILPISDGGLSI